MSNADWRASGVEFGARRRAPSYLEALAGSSLRTPNRKRVARLIILLFAAILHGCDGSPKTGLITAPSKPLMWEDYGDTECPPDVAESDCEPMTAAERQLIYDDIQNSIRWDLKGVSGGRI